MRRNNQTMMCHRERGVVLVLTILASLLLSGIVMFVLNLGDQVNKRIEAQHTADSSAQAGAGWTARTLNTVAANNMDMARYIAMINILDAMPQAVEYTTVEMTKFKESMELTAPYDTVDTEDSKLNEKATGFFGDLYGIIVSELNDLEPVNQHFQSFDVAEMTLYSRNGSIWQALVALDELNQALMENIPTTTQAAAVSGGEANQGLGDGENRGVVMFPLEPEVPYQRGRFDDFELPVRRGLPPFTMVNPLNPRALQDESSLFNDTDFSVFQDDDDEPEDLPINTVPPRAIRITNNIPDTEWEKVRGPWDAVLGWRRIVSMPDPNAPARWVPGSPGSRGGVGGGSGRPPLSRGEGNNGSSGRWVGGGSIPIGYSTYGPYQWMLERIGNYTNRYRFSRLMSRLSSISRIKLNYAWPRERPRAIYEPVWEIDYETARGIAEAGDPRIRETAFFVVEIKSKYKKGEGGFMSPGSYSLAFEDGQQNPRIAIQGGWVDPERWESETIQRMGAGPIWRGEWEYTVEWDNSIGISREDETVPDPNDPNNTITQPKLQTVYRYDYFVFAGVNTGPQAEVRNPYEGFEPEADDAPSPTDLDHGEIRVEDHESRQRYLSVLGVARRTDEAVTWPSKFTTGRPSDDKVAMAQARIFNNHSFDLWTQMWRAELAPITDFDLWVDIMGDGSGGSYSQSDDAEKIREYMESSKDMARVMLGH